jgi:ketosteroid isomerase-like protein
MQNVEQARTPLEIVRDHYAASARGDFSTAMADLAPDARWTEMAGFPCAGTWGGTAEVVENVFKVLGSEWIGYRLELESLIAGTDRIVGIGTYHGTFRKTGKSMQARVAHVWQVTGGKIVRFEQFTDTLIVRRAMDS